MRVDGNHTHTHTHTVRPGSQGGSPARVSDGAPDVNHLALSDHKFGSLFRNFSAVILRLQGRHWGALVRWGLGDGGEAHLELVRAQHSYHLAQPAGQSSPWMYAVKGFQILCRPTTRPSPGNGSSPFWSRPDCAGHSPGKKEGKQRQAQLFSPGLHPTPPCPNRGPRNRPAGWPAAIPMLQMREPRPFERPRRAAVHAALSH